ncbi:MAG: hypothetical protein JSR70_02980 [Proteobacteria bacterium]|nr:hypothetical protein [Pseudomonadota bacterium]
MNRLFASCLAIPLLLLPCLGMAQEPVVTKPAGVVVERTFWVKAGKERQFAMLFDRTQLPRLKALLNDRQITSFSTASPLIHTGNDQWAFRVRIRWSSWDAFAKDASARVDQKSNPTLTYEQALFGDLVIDRKDTVIQEDNFGAAN